MLVSIVATAVLVSGFGKRQQAVDFCHQLGKVSVNWAMIGDEKWRAAEKLVGSFEEGAIRGAVYDSSFLLPKYIPSQYDLQRLNAASAFKAIFEDKAISMEAIMPHSGKDPRISGEGIPLTSLSRNTAGAVLASSTFEASNSESDARFTLQFDSFIKFIDPSGNEETFKLKPGWSGGALTDVPLPIGLSNELRIPEKFAKVLHSLRFQLVPSDKLVSLHDLIGRLNSLTRLNIFPDRRVEFDYLNLRFNPGAVISAYDLALGISRCMDMYWRPVGRSYLLADSPESPIAESHRRFELRLSSLLAQLGSKVQARSGIPKGLSLANLLEPPRPLSEFGPGFVPSLIKSISFSSELERQKFASIVEGNQGTKLTVKFQAVTFTNIYSRSGGGGGVAFTIGE